MESLGNKLKTACEAKGYTIEYASQETNIAARYLAALEREDYDVFPGEPYALGFLKNYGAYLELDVNELLSLYRAVKIQEQPTPIEAIFRPPPKILKRLGIIIALALVVLGLAYTAYWFITTKIDFSPKEIVLPPRSPTEYTLNTGSLERRFYRGDTVLVSSGEETYKLELSGISDTVTITTPGGLVRLDLSQEALVDLNDDGFNELRITVADFAKNDSATGALLYLEVVSPPGGAEVVETVPSQGLNPGSQGSTVIFTSSDAYPFTLQAVFQGYCLFRWEILAEPNRSGRNEQYFQQSDELNIQAQNGIRIGLSNAHAVRLQVIGGGRTVTLEPGGPGEVVVADIRWLRDEENRYRLVFARLE